MAGALNLEGYLEAVAHADPTPVQGTVTRVVGLLVESIGPQARIGDVCEVRRGRGPAVLREPVGGVRGAGEEVSVCPASRERE